MRVDYAKAFPSGHEAMLQLEGAVRRSELEPLLLELVKLRSSQLNGCAYCLDMHSKDARARGEDEQRLNVLAAWREAPYSPRERAYAELEPQFLPEEIAALTFQIVAINGWNRLAVGLRTPVGDYVSPFHQAAGASA